MPRHAERDLRKKNTRIGCITRIVRILKYSLRPVKLRAEPLIEERPAPVLCALTACRHKAAQGQAGSIIRIS